VTGYYLELGYNAALGLPQQEHAWNTLLAIFNNIIAAPDRIVAEVTRLEPLANPTTIREIAEWYTHPDRKDTEDCTYRIHDKPDFVAPLDSKLDPVPFKPFIAQNASSGNGNRGAKESVRRAVCRLVIEDMHRLKLEVNLRVS
jgi:hypothetical protein